MPDAAAAEAAERKRVMEAVAKCLEGALWEYGQTMGYLTTPSAADRIAAVVHEAITELRTPVGRGRTE